MAEGRADALTEGLRLHVYTIGSVLGAGGFGITYRAAEAYTDRLVAIKEFLPNGLAMRAQDGVSVRPLSGANADFSWGLERFRQEARTLIALKHPNVVPVLQYFEANGTGYLVMEYQEGCTLGARLRPDKHLNSGELDRILPPILDALEAVHGRGFLHRDLKPDNVFIRSDGTPLLLDFGAARQAVGAKSQNLTAIVSEGYAPLEQYGQGSDQGPWTDIYALGCTLYRCMTGVRPSPAPQRMAVFLANGADPIANLREITRTNYALSLIAAVEAAIRSAASERPQSIATFRTLLRDGAGTSGAETIAGLLTPNTATTIALLNAPRATPERKVKPPPPKLPPSKRLQSPRPAASEVDVKAPPPKFSTPKNSRTEDEWIRKGRVWFAIAWASLGVSFAISVALLATSKPISIGLLQIVLAPAAAYALAKSARGSEAAYFWLSLIQFAYLLVGFIPGGISLLIFGWTFLPFLGRGVGAYVRASRAQV